MNICHEFRYGKIIYNVLDEYVGKSLKLYGEYSPEEANLFAHMIFKGQCVVEVGANIGAHTVQLAQLVGDTGVVWAFEPQRLVFQILAGNVAINSLANVYCEQKCVSDKPGRMRVPVLDAAKVNNWGGVSLEQAGTGDFVDVITLDSLNLPRCDFLKIDVEGMELQVLRGGKNLIETYRPIIYAEADRPEKNSALFAWLQGAGYRIYRHTAFLYNKNNYFGNPENVFRHGRTVLASLNVLCVPKDGQITVEGLEEVVI